MARYVDGNEKDPFSEQQSLLDNIITQSRLIYDKCFEDSNKELDYLYTLSKLPPKVSVKDILSGIAQCSDQSFQKAFSVLKSPYEKVNFVCGNTRIQDFQTILFNVLYQYEDNDHKKVISFIDLGCGNGECLSATLLFDYILSSTNKKMKFSRLLGVDLQEKQIESANYLFKSLVKDIRESENESYVWPDIDIFAGDFIEQPWSDFANRRPVSLAIDRPTETDPKTVVLLYLCATCFTESLLKLILSKVVIPLSDPLVSFNRHALTSLYVISLDKDLRSYVPPLSESSNGNLMLELLFEQNCETSWGNGKAYVYRIDRQIEQSHNRPDPTLALHDP
jgi:hypothetical protein